MGKYFGIVIGALVLLLGIGGLLLWHADLFTVLRGTLPALFVLAGAIAVVAAVSEMKDEFSSGKGERK